MTDETKTDKAVASIQPSPRRPVEPSETIVGSRRIGKLLHIWLFDTRTSTVRRVEADISSIPGVWFDALATAELAILDHVKEAHANGF